MQEKCSFVTVFGTGEKEKKNANQRDQQESVMSPSASTKQVKKKVKKIKDNFGQVPAEDLRPGLEEGLLQSSRT
ncbi:hypothetical protein TNIN_177411 [Trichonephila inaurata madagascariensis]|uniref:Uncharacterized protein n=1 Tax=Trichonephila inaurata madagascariensis TaxID=2747483 RepID=A0A8X7CJ67_9ARAC|nr:hypothetical protein TNIN_177411 [Trichonephila inaurata madagascariensis]